MPTFFSSLVAAFISDIWRSHSWGSMIPASLPASRALMAPRVLSPMHPWQSTGKTLALMPALLIDLAMSSPMIMLAQVPTTATVSGWNLSSTCFRVLISGSSPPNTRSLSLMPDVTTLTSASSSGLDAMKLQPAGPCSTMTSTSMSRSVYIAATMGFGRGWMIVLTGRPPSRTRSGASRPRGSPASRRPPW